MKVKNAFVHYGRLVKTIKYENVRLEYGLEVTLEEGENWRGALDQIRSDVKGKLQHDLQEEINFLTGGPGYGG